MSSIPEDVYVDIFTRLPMKSLLACRCVGKFWCQIISNPNFVKMHLVHAKRKINTSIMFTDCGTIYTKTYDLISSSKKLCEFDDPVERDHPFEPRDHVDLLGSCDGLVYIWIHSRELFCIWNPATKEYKIMPKSSEKHMKRDIVMHGFDYDCKIDDYKIINVLRKDDRYIVNVYILGTNSWKTTHTLFDVRVFWDLKRGLLVNGALHWSAVQWGKDSNKIISLDISSEKFNAMEPPKEVSENMKCWMNVGALEGLLCVLDDVYMVQLDVWVMQNYGDPESWTKLYAITNERIKVYSHTCVNKSAKYNHDVKLIWQFDKGEILFSTCEKLVLYDPKHKSARELRHMRYVDFLKAVDYVESLVSVNSGTYVAGTKKTKKRKIFL